MKSIGYIAFFSIVMMLNGCTVGPSPENYKQAVKSISSTNDVIGYSSAQWYTNVLLGSITSFHSPSVEGNLFVTPKKLIFAVYDESTNRFLQTYEVAFSKITWVKGKKHGLARIINFQSNNTIQSFIFGGYVKGLNKDQLLEYILSHVKTKN